MHQKDEGDALRVTAAQAWVADGKETFAILQLARPDDRIAPLSSSVFILPLSSPRSFSAPSHTYCNFPPFSSSSSPLSPHSNSVKEFLLLDYSEKTGCCYLDIELTPRVFTIHDPPASQSQNQVLTGGKAELRRDAPG